MRMWEIREGDYSRDDYHYGRKHSGLRDHEDSKSYDEAYEEGYEEGYAKAMKDASSYYEKDSYRRSR